MLLDYLVDRMLTGYEQDDDVTVLVVHSPRREPGAPARRVGANGGGEEGQGMTDAGTIPARGAVVSARELAASGRMLYDLPADSA